MLLLILFNGFHYYFILKIEGKDMSLKVKSTSLISHKNYLFIKKVISSSALGYLAGRIFSIINPYSAVIFNLTAEITHSLTTKLFKRMNFLKNSKLTKEFIKSFISFSAAFAFANLICKFTLVQALKVTAFTLITQIAIANILGLVVVMGSFAILANMSIFNAYDKLKISLKA